MRILYLNHYAGSPEMGMEFRPYYLAREWVRMGHEVTIVAGDYSHLRRINPVVTRDFQEQDIDGITYCWVRTGEYEGNGAARAMSMLRFVGKMMTHAKELVERYRPDVVIASSTYPLDTYAAQLIRKLSGAKYLHEIHDMWPVTLYEVGGMPRRHPFVQMMQVAENSFCRNTDLVVSIPPATESYLKAHGLSDGKFACIQNGIVLSEWENPAPLPEEHIRAIRDFKKDKSLIIGFFGSHTRSYALEYLIDAVISSGKDVGAVFLGNGIDKQQLVSKAVGHEDQTLFLPPISKNSVPSFTAEMDALYVGGVKNSVFRFGISMNKLFDSMMSGRPILFAVDAPNDLISEYQCGISVPAENVQLLCEGIDLLKSFTPAQRDAIGARGKQAVLEHYTYEQLANQFMDAMEAA